VLADLEGPRIPSRKLPMRNQSPFVGPTVALLAALLVAGALSGPSGAAQWPEHVRRLAMVGTERAALLVTTSGGFARSASPGHQLVWRVAAPLGHTATSPGYRLEVLPAGPELPLPPGPPALVAVTPDGGAALGGTAVQLRGLRFDTPGAPLSAARFGATVVAASSTSSLIGSTVTPSGLNPFGNPLGSVPVEVSSALGADLGGARFEQLPALVQAGPAQLGASLPLRLRAPEAGFGQLILGESIPGFALALPPYLGAFELVALYQPLGGPVALFTGSHTYQIPLPPTPQFAGATVRFQALCLYGAAGSFTNVLPVLLQQ
jgi:hypothetical protein